MTPGPSQNRRLAVMIATIMIWASIGSGVFSLSGCAPAEPVFDKATQYTSESLASEFIFRYKSMNLKAKRAPAPSKRNRGKLTAQQEERLAKKSGEQSKTKKAETATLEDLLEDMAKKAETVKSATPSKTLREMASLVGKSSQIEGDDRKILEERIEGVAGSFE